MPKPKVVLDPHIPFDNSHFATLMHRVDDSPSADQDECLVCGEHMLDCECEDSHG